MQLHLTINLSTHVAIYFICWQWQFSGSGSEADWLTPIQKKKKKYINISVLQNSTPHFEVYPQPEPSRNRRQPNDVNLNWVVTTGKPTPFPPYPSVNSQCIESSEKKVETSKSQILAISRRLHSNKFAHTAWNIVINDMHPGITMPNNWPRTPSTVETAAQEGTWLGCGLFAGNWRLA